MLLPDVMQRALRQYQCQMKRERYDAQRRLAPRRNRLGHLVWPRKVIDQDTLTLDFSMLEQCCVRWDVAICEGARSIDFSELIGIDSFNLDMKAILTSHGDQVALQIATRRNFMAGFLGANAPPRCPRRRNTKVRVAVDLLAVREQSELHTALDQVFTHIRGAVEISGSGVPHLVDAKLLNAFGVHLLQRMSGHSGFYDNFQEAERRSQKHLKELQRRCLLRMDTQVCHRGVSGHAVGGKCLRVRDRVRVPVSPQVLALSGVRSIPGLVYLLRLVEQHYQHEYVWCVDVILQDAGFLLPTTFNWHTDSSPAEAGQVQASTTLICSSSQDGSIVGVEVAGHDVVFPASSGTIFSMVRMCADCFHRSVRQTPPQIADNNFPFQVKVAVHLAKREVYHQRLRWDMFTGHLPGDPPQGSSATQRI